MIAARPRLGALLLAMLTLAGCVSFEFAPVATLDCDRSLAGAWQPSLPMDEAAPKDEDRHVTVSATCEISGRRGDGELETHRFGTFDFEGHHYIAVNAEEPVRVTDANDKLIETWPESRVELFRYRVDGDRMLLWSANPAAAESFGGEGVTVHSDATIDPETGKPMPQLVRGNVYLSGSREALAALLRTRGDALYVDMRPDKAMVFTRTPEATAP